MSSTRQPSARAAAPLAKLVREMIGTFERLGRDRMARIDARIWAKYYARRARKIGVGTKG